MEARNLLKLPLLFRPFAQTCRPRSTPSTLRKLTTSRQRLAIVNPSSPTPASASTTDTTHTSLGQLGEKIGRASASARTPSPPTTTTTTNTTTTTTTATGATPPSSLEAISLSRFYAEHPSASEHHLHVYAHKHNTHLTLTNEARNAIISISCGNLGFRKSQRGTYDAAFQLAAYLLTRMQQQGLMAKIEFLELVYRGFGQGRDAVTKVIMGVEGARLRGKICRVVDKTRLKIGGTRSPKPR
ncbi:MAG: hypothetical protein LQ340_002061, partial [Diploschistes diacapsis]